MRVQRLLFVTGSAWVLSGAAIVMFSAHPNAQQPADRSSAAERPPHPQPAAGPPPNPNAAATARGPQEHDGAARHQGAAAGPERQRDRAEPRQLRRGAGQSVSRTCPTSLTLKNGKKVTTRRRSGGSSAGRRSSRTSSAKCSAACRRTCRRSRGRSPRRPSATVGGTPVIGKQLVGHVDNSAYPGDRRRHPDDARDAGGRDEAGAGDDDVRRRRHALHPALRRRRAGSAGRGRRAPVGAAAQRRSACDRAADRRRLGLRARSIPAASRPTTAPG